MKMLKHFEVQPNSNWNDFVLYLVKDVRFKAVKKMSQRMKLFGLYKSSLKLIHDEKAKMEEAKILEDARTNLKKLLQVRRLELMKCEHFLEAAKILGDEHDFKALDKTPKIREQIFEDYMQELKEEMHETKEKINQHHREIFEGVIQESLASGKLTLDATWDSKEVRSLCRVSHSYQFLGHEECKSLFLNVMTKESKERIKQDEEKKLLAEKKRTEEEEKLKKAVGEKKRIEKMLKRLNQMTQVTPEEKKK